MSTRIFISHRQSDSLSKEFVNLLYQGLREVFFEDEIYLDSTTPARVNSDSLKSTITSALASCEVLLVIIGPEWERITETKKGNSEFDWVIFEIKEGLQKRGTAIVPIVLGDTPFPNKSITDRQEIEALGFLHANKIPRPTSESDIADLVKAIRSRYNNIYQGVAFATGGAPHSLIGDYMSKAQYHIRILSTWTLIIGSQYAILEDILKENRVTVEFLLLDPLSKTVKARENDLKSQGPINLKQEISGNVKDLKRLYKKYPQSNLYLRFYDGLLSFPVYWIDSRSFIGFFARHSNSFHLPHLAIEDMSSPMGRMIEDEFMGIWNTAPKILNFTSGKIEHREQPVIF